MQAGPNEDSRSTDRDEMLALIAVRVDLCTWSKQLADFVYPLLVLQSIRPVVVKAEPFVKHNQRVIANVPYGKGQLTPVGYQGQRVLSNL